MPFVITEPFSTFTDGVQASLAPWNDPAGDWQAYNAALAAMFEPVYSIVVPRGSPDDPATYQAGWSTLLDPTACPDAYLPYLAQFVGVQIPAGTSAPTARGMILARQNFNTGLPSAVIAATKRFLTGTQSVTLLERTAADGSAVDPYHFVLLVRRSELAGTSNAVPNGSFEHDTVGGAPAGWLTAATDSFPGPSAGATLTVQPSAPNGTDPAGAHVLEVTTTAAGQGAIIALDKRTVGIYTVALEIQGTTGGEFFVRAGTASNVISSVLYSFGEPTWGSVSLEMPITDDTEIVWLAVIAASGPMTFYLDAVIAAPGTTTPAYVDGDTPGEQWVGTPGNSATIPTVAALAAAVDAVRPVGVQWTLVVVDTWTIDELEPAYATISAAEAAFPTISNLETDVT